MFNFNKKITYYTDETKDDFAGLENINTVSTKVDKNFNFLPTSILFKVFSFVFYYLFACPILFLANLLFFKTKTVGRKNIKHLKNQGFFVYANHTHYKDAWLTPISVAPARKNYIISNKAAFEIPVVRHLVQAGGALPVPDTPVALINLSKAINKIIENKKVITIFPEAHIWPYYTGIRPFPITSFRFAANANAPAVPVAVCYKQKKFLGNIRKPKTVVFIGKPIYPKPNLTKKENAEFLRNQTYNYIKTTLKQESTYSYIIYKKVLKKPVNQTTAKTADELSEQVFESKV